MNSVQFIYTRYKDNLMTKIRIITFLFSIFCFSPAMSEEYGKFYEDVLISSDVRLNENAENAKNALLEKCIRAYRCKTM